MPELSFDTLRAELLESGIAPRHIRRIIAELDDHLLRDIGLDRDTVRRETAKPFWRA